MEKELETKVEEIKEGTNPNVEEGKETKENTITLEEAMTLLAQERAEKAKLKNSFDRTSSELADTKKQLKARLTAEEQEQEAKKEAEEEHKKYVKGLEDELATIRATQRYMGLGMSTELAEETAKAEISGDIDSVTENMKKHQEALLKKKEAEWLQSRPPVNAGNPEGEDKKDPFLEGFNS